MSRLFTVISIVLLCVALVGCQEKIPASVNEFNQWQLDQYPALTFNESIWSVISDHYKINHDKDQPAIEKEIRWYQRNRYILYQELQKSSPYIYYVYQQTQKRGLPSELALLPMIESNYQPFAYSHAGAVGIWQLMPGTASGLGVKINWWYDGRRDLVKSTDVALNHLSYLYGYFNDNWDLAIAAYDSGAGTVDKALRHRNTDNTNVWQLRLPRETRKYLPKLLALAIIIGNPNKYGVKLPPIPDQPYLTSVKVGGQIELAKAARLADISLATLRQLNPGFRRWATDPDGPFRLLLPTDKAKRFVQRIQAMPKSQWVTWRHYRVHHGDDLIKIAKHHHTTVEEIRKVNHLHSNLLHINQLLLIPNSRYANHNKIHHEGAKIAENYLPGPKKLTHTVRNGQNLSDIARANDVKASAIRFWNNLSYKQPLKAGQQLIIWKKPPKHHTIHIRYRVKSGDSLDKIAKLYRVTAKDLQRWNHLATSTIIHPNQKLNLYLIR